LGRYRLELDPGEYVVMARQVVIPSNMTVLRDGRGGLVITTRGRGRGNPSASNAAAGNPAAQTPKVVYVPAFYPAGGSDPAQAGTVRVPPGGEIHGIDFALRPTQSGVITGTVTPPGEPTRDSESQTGARPNPAVEPFRSTVSLVPAGFETRIGDPIVDAQEPPSVTAGSDGKFQFNDVLPGLYRLVVSQPRTRELMAIQDVDVRPGDTQALSIALQRGVDVSGRLQFDSPLPPNFDIRRCVATLRLDDRVNGFIEPRTNVNSDGSFVLKNVAPNLRYRVAFANLEQNWNPLELMYRPSSYLASVRYGDFDATVMPFTVRNEAPRIEAHVAFASGTVEILPTDRDQPQQGIPTLLVFQQHGQQNFEFRVSDASGKATFTNMPPGDYRVFAWDEIREGSWLGEPAFFDQIENRARKIHVENGATTTETVPIIKVEGGDLR
jgi:hypothetical protein